jgi:hypothetical protein
LNLPPETKHN